MIVKMLLNFTVQMEAVLTANPVLMPGVTSNRPFCLHQ
jgi:hypothetical protein